MSGVVLSQDTYLNKGTALSVIGSGGGGGGGINSVTGLAPNIVTQTVAGAVTVDLNSNLGNISSITFVGATGNITGVSSINGVAPAGASASITVSTIYMNPATAVINNANTLTNVELIQGNELKVDFNATGDTAVEPWSRISYANSSLSMTTSILVTGSANECTVNVARDRVSLSAADLNGPKISQITIFPEEIRFESGTQDNLDVIMGAGAVLTAPSIIGVSSINGNPVNEIPTTVDIPTGLGGFGLTDPTHPANVAGSVTLGLSTTLTAGHRYIYSPTFALSTSGAGYWPVGNASASCWLTGQTSEILGGPWQYAALSTAQGGPTGVPRVTLTPTSMFGATATSGQNSFSPNLFFSADWPMATVVAVSSLQAASGDFYATTLVDLGIPSNL
jgi:hypothetical protein